MGEVASPSADWNEAILRLEDYLRAHRVADRERLLRLNLEILEESRRIHSAAPARRPLDVVMELATARTEAWFSRLVDETAAPEAQLAARGRAIWFASGLDRQWPAAFLDPAPSPALLAAIRSGSLQAGPALEFSSLIRTEVDYGALEDIAEGTWQQFSWRHTLGAFLIWVIIFFAAYGAWLRFFAP